MNFTEAVKEMVEKNGTCIYQDGSESGVRMRYSNSLKSFVRWTDSNGWIKIEFSKFHYLSDSWSCSDEWNLLQDLRKEWNEPTLNSLKHQINTFIEKFDDDINKYSNLDGFVDTDSIMRILKNRLGW